MQKKSVIATLAIGAGVIGTHRFLTYGPWGLIPPIPGALRTAFRRKMMMEAARRHRESYTFQRPGHLSRSTVDSFISEMEKESFAGRGQ